MLRMCSTKRLHYIVWWSGMLDCLLAVMIILWDVIRSGQI